MSGLRIGIDSSFLDRPGCDPKVSECLRDAVAVLIDAGATVTEVQLPLWDEVTTAMMVGLAEAASYHLGDLRTRWDDYGRPTRRTIGTAVFATGADYVQAQRVRRVGVRAVAEMFESYDLVLTPTALTGAPALAGLDFEAMLPDVLTPYWNAVGNPAMSIPMGLSAAGLPIGLQIAGRPFDEATVLLAADAFQRATDHHLVESAPRSGAALMTALQSSPTRSQAADALPLTISAAAAALRDGTLTAVDLVQATQRRADALDPALGVYLMRLDESALAAAATADAELASGLDRGLLHGIPIGIKDIISTADGPSTAQSLILRPEFADQGDALVVSRLRAAGAVIAGKVTTSEYACGMPDDSKGFPRPRNPFGLDYWTGGSSAGSGGGVAAGLFPRRARHRHRGQHPDPGVLVRHQRYEADLRPGAQVRLRPDRFQLRPHRPDDPLGPRRRRDAGGARRTRRVRRGQRRRRGSGLRRGAYRVDGGAAGRGRPGLAVAPEL